MGGRAEAAQAGGKVDPLGRPKVSSGVEAAAYGLPGELPTTHEGVAQTLLQVGLKVQTSEAGGTGTVADDGKVVPNDADNALGGLKAR